MPAPLGSPTLAAYLESGVSILLGTVDAALVPECVRCVGARVEAGGHELTVFVPQPPAGATRANLAASGRAAVFFSRPVDHHSLQVKGRSVEVVEAGERDRAFVDRYLAELRAVLGEIGLPPRDLARAVSWPCWAVRLRVDAVYVQTPGPRAGERLGGPGAGP